MIKYSYISENGSRQVNEDSVAVAEKRGKYCFTLCDGLGGHGNGDVASRTVTETFSKIFEETRLNPKDFFQSAYSQSNSKVLELQKEKGAPYGMKTTVVSLLASDTKCVWSHIGDSRLYCFDKKSVKTRTLDHSVPQMLVVSKEIKEKDIRFHPDRNKILRAVGTDDETPRYQLSETVKTKECNAFLLCSDGFWEFITERAMCRALRRSKTPEEWLERMKKTVIRKGKNKNMDNFSAIAVFVNI